MDLIVFMEEEMKNPVAKDLRTPKYRMRVVTKKTVYRRSPKHKGALNV
jgi:hypothetical protein